MNKIIILLIICFCITTPLYAESDDSSVFDTHQIEALVGAKGVLDEESNEFEISIPRTDINVSAAGIKLTPGLGLVSCATFKTLGSTGEVIGDVVLFEDQINLVMKEALENGLNITALYHHSLWDNPRIMQMHMEGKGPIKDLAMAVGTIFNIIKKSNTNTIWARPPVIINSAKSTLNPNYIEELLGKKGNLKDGVYKLTWERETWAAFVGTDREAAILGNIAMKEEEAQNVLKTLLKHNIFIVSLHQHKMEENPKTMVVRYMGRGSAFKLAEMLKEALEQITLSSTEKPQVE